MIDFDKRMVPPAIFAPAKTTIQETTDTISNIIKSVEIWRRVAHDAEIVRSFLTECIVPTIGITRLQGKFEVLICGKPFDLPIDSLNDREIAALQQGRAWIALFLILNKETDRTPPPQWAYAEPLKSLLNRIIECPAPSPKP